MKSNGRFHKSTFLKEKKLKVHMEVRAYSSREAATDGQANKSRIVYLQNSPHKSSSTMDYLVNKPLICLRSRQELLIY